MLRKLIQMPYLHKERYFNLSKPTRKIDLYIEIVGSSNPRLNAMVKGSELTIARTLKKNYRKVKVSIVDDLRGLEELVAKKPDLVVLGMKLILLDPKLEYDVSPKIWLSTYLNERGIAVTGSDTDALMLEYNKDEAKQVVLDAGLLSAEYFMSPAHEPVFNHSLSYPLFVKPVNRGDSKGIDEKSVVHTDLELITKALAIHKELESDVLVESYLTGKEYSVAVMRKAGTDELIAYPVEIQAPTDSHGNQFLSEKVKEADTEQVLAIEDLHIRKLVSEHAVGVFRALDARDYGRIDMRMDSHGLPHFIEANLMPGLTTSGYLYRCFSLNSTLTYGEMIGQVIELAVERVTEEKRSFENLNTVDDLLDGQMQQV